ncbi:hypothetical protein CG017_05776 (plasmid) [Burkholderia glumae]|nr:hypothetical protein CG017_05776 [Burkholderia glumae]
MQPRPNVHQHDIWFVLERSNTLEKPCQAIGESNYFTGCIDGRGIDTT